MEPLELRLADDPAVPVTRRANNQPRNQCCIRRSPHTATAQPGCRLFLSFCKKWFISTSNKEVSASIVALEGSFWVNQDLNLTPHTHFPIPKEKKRKPGPEMVEDLNSETRWPSSPNIQRVTQDNHPRSVNRKPKADKLRNDLPSPRWPP